MSHLKLVQQSHIDTKLDQDCMEELFKGGVGSGRKGHMSPNVQALKERLNQMRERKQFSQKTKSGKPITTESHHGTAMGYSPQDHRDAMSFHYNKAAEHRAHAAQVKDPEERQAHLAIAKEHARHMSAHSSAGDAIERRRAKVLEAQRSKKS